MHLQRNYYHLLIQYSANTGLRRFEPTLEDTIRLVQHCLIEQLKAYFHDHVDNLGYEVVERGT